MEFPRSLVFENFLISLERKEQLKKLHISLKTTVEMKKVINFIKENSRVEK